jgi:carbonic anhydrase
MIEQWQTLLAAHDAVRDPLRSLVPDHAPRAAVLTCSDARVPPSVIFDQPAGSLFIVRVAGNTATAAAVASFDYAVAQLGVELLVVLGHTNCGAVAAACGRGSDGYLEPLTAAISELVDDSDGGDSDELAQRNVEATVAVLAGSPSPAGDAIRSGAVAIVGAMYDLATDDVRCLPQFLNRQPCTTESQEPLRP